MRALYQRKKGRDLLDLVMAIRDIPGLNTSLILKCFDRYMTHVGAKVTRAQFEQNLAEKLLDDKFLSDIGPLLVVGAPEFDSREAGERVKDILISLLPGDAWKGNPNGLKR